MYYVSFHGTMIYTPTGGIDLQRLGNDVRVDFEYGLNNQSQIA